jgi:hypothetical protein
MPEKLSWLMPGSARTQLTQLKISPRGNAQVNETRPQQEYETVKMSALREQMSFSFPSWAMEPIFHKWITVKCQPFSTLRGRRIGRLGRRGQKGILKAKEFTVRQTGHC